MKSNRQLVIAELMLHFHSNQKRVISALTMLAKEDEEYSQKLPKGETIDIVSPQPNATFYH